MMWPMILEDFSLITIYSSLNFGNGSSRCLFGSFGEKASDHTIMFLIPSTFKPRRGMVIETG